MEAVGMGKRFSTKMLASGGIRPTFPYKRSEGLTLGVCRNYMALLLLPGLFSTQLAQHIFGGRPLCMMLKMI
eukprot:3092777-Karenia_brevis.AAC.1